MASRAKRAKHSAYYVSRAEGRKLSARVVYRLARFPFAQIIILIGVLLCMAPLLSNWYGQWESAHSVQSITDKDAHTSPKDKAAILAQAHAYNARLGGYEPDTALSQPIKPYEQQLNAHHDGVMGWLEVPKAGIRMPVFHGTADAALSAGVGHQDETSLPVGGKRAKTVLSGHSGMKSFRVFDGIRVLEKGDVAALHVLGDVYAYRVVSWKIQDPEDVDLRVGSSDELVLVTCTTTPDRLNPKGRIGINDKRLVVIAKRTPYDPSEFEHTKPSLDVYVNDNTRPALLAAGILTLFGIGLAVAVLLSRRRKRAQRSESDERNQPQARASSR